MQQLTDLLSKGGFHLTKRVSSHREVLESIPVAERSPSVMSLDLDDLPIDRALGDPLENSGKEPGTSANGFSSMIMIIMIIVVIGKRPDVSLLPDKQKGCRRGSRGTKDQLITDKAVLRDYKRRKTNLAIAWIDYRKANDMIPHSWIEECLEVFGIAKNV